MTKMDPDFRPSLHIIGAGAFGSALAMAYSRHSCFHVLLWARNVCSPDNPFPRLPQFSPPSELTLRQGLPEITDIGPDDIILLAVPTQNLRQVCRELPQNMPPSVTLVTCCKGLERKTSLMPLEILEETLKSQTNFVLAGPNFASGIAGNLPSVATLAGKNLEHAGQIAKTLSLPFFSLSPSDDPIAIQITGAAKNVIAIGVGAAMGAGLGENARAAFITHFIQELNLFIQKSGGKAETFLTSGGIGDLLLTATSSSSRNYALGEYLGKNKTYPPNAGTDKEAVTEGAFTAPVLLEKALAFNIHLPAVHAINKILETPEKTEEIVRKFLTR